MTDASLLPCVESGPTSEEAGAVVLWLHGLGADGHDFAPIVPQLGLDDLHVRFVFPHAPSMPVTVNGGFVMPAWFDVAEVDLRREPDVAGVRRSAAQIDALLAREEERGVPSGRIVLAGFSQGGVVALHTGLRHGRPLAALVGLSTYLASPEALVDERAEANRDTPILLCHGSQDPLVPIARGGEARDHLAGLGHDVTWHDYPMQHEVCWDEIETIGRWLRKRLTASAR